MIGAAEALSHAVVSGALPADLAGGELAALIVAVVGRAGFRPAS